MRWSIDRVPYAMEPLEVRVELRISRIDGDKEIARVRDRFGVRYLYHLLGVNISISVGARVTYRLLKKSVLGLGLGFG